LKDLVSAAYKEKYNAPRVYSVCEGYVAQEIEGNELGVGADLEGQINVMHRIMNTCHDSLLYNVH
jgi:hypothetical protein